MARVTAGRGRWVSGVTRPPAGRTHQRRELVARGLSNPDIATELYVSRRTVQTHVSNIVIKLDLRSRVEVAREYASRTGTMSR